MKTAYYFWKLSRPVNLLITWLTFASACYFSNLRNLGFLLDWFFWIESVLILIITANGYWINDVFDYKIDRINKPEKTIVNIFLSPKKVLTGYFISSGVVALSSWLMPWKFICIHYVSMITLYLYARYFKRQAITGNLVVSAMTALVVITGSLMYHVKIPLMWMSIFAFLITFIREITKDIEDIRGDMQFKLQTLPIQIGIKSTKEILNFCYFSLVIACNLPIIFAWKVQNQWAVSYAVYSLFLVQLPLLWLWIRMRHSKLPKEFGAQSLYLKYIMISGLGSIFLLA